MASLIALAPLSWTTVQQTYNGAQFTEFASDIDTVLKSQRNTMPHLYEPGRTIGRLWHFPHDLDDTYGLGGGITYAWDPKLCDKILPLFREDMLVSDLVHCGDIKQALSRAFSSWQNNHRWLKFVDVTAECEDIQGKGMVNESCPLVELWITDTSISEADDALARASGDVNENGVAIALATSIARYTQNRPQCEHHPYMSEAFTECASFRMTNGVELHGRYDQPDANRIIEIYKAKIQFGSEYPICWYLDSSFCSAFHDLKRWSTPGNILMLTRLVVFFVFAVAVLTMLFRCRVCGSCHRRAKRIKKGNASCSCRKRFHHIYEEAASWSVMGLTMQLVLIICPPMVQYKIFEPCFQCYDFEGAAVHEIGHVLGLGHPNTAREEVGRDMLLRHGTRGDNVYNARLSQGTRYNSTTCLNPWADVANNTPPDAPLDELGCYRGTTSELIFGCEGIRNSVMEAFTQNNPSVCLAQDDLDGIQTLYPDCELSITTPVCYRTNLNLGIVRIATYVLFPLLVILSLVVMMQSVLQHHNREQIKEQKLDIKIKRKQVVAGRLKLAVRDNTNNQAASSTQNPAAPPGNSPWQPARSGLTSPAAMSTVEVSLRT